MHALDSRKPDFRLRRPRRQDQSDGILSGIRPPLSYRWMTTMLLIVLPLFAALLLLTPWQQAALGTGRVIAFSPGEREQNIDAQIDARITSWNVQEGQQVKAGELLGMLSDNDPSFFTRLTAQRDAARDAAAAAEAQIVSYEAKTTAAEAQVELVVAEYASKIASLRRKRVGEATAVDTEARDYDRQVELASEGIASQRKLDVSRMKRDKAQAALDARDQEIAATTQAAAKARQEAVAKAAAAQAELLQARAKLADAQAKLASAEVKLSRQDAQEIRAVQDGTVLKVFGGPGAWVKKGDSLVTIIPATDSRAVELKVSGNDAPLIHPGEEVRVVFEGWPALQFVGLRSANSPGTFPGEVAIVDATDDGSGKFRIVVVPADDNVWPEASVLRQGVRARGWVLLGQVSLGYELWRQINGFPALPPADKGDKPTLPSNKKPRNALDE